MNWWPWSRDEPSEEAVKAQERLDQVNSDDKRVNDLTRRAKKIERENGLAPAIMKALGVER